MEHQENRAMSAVRCLAPGILASSVFLASSAWTRGQAMQPATQPAVTPAMQPTTQPTTQPAEHFAEGEVLPPAPPGTKSALSDIGVAHLDVAHFPKRPAPIIELGNPFFGTGKINNEITLPTGEAITPTFIVFGTYRTVFQAFENPQQNPPGSKFSPNVEWANRLDLYANLQLSGTERILAGFRPLDDATFEPPKKARYFGYNVNPTDTDGWVDNSFNVRPTTLFFQGDVGQMFPGLDPYDTKQMDIGFAVGRQPLIYQDGILIDDDVDSVGITRNTIILPGVQNFQATALYGWSQINRGDGVDYNDPGLFGMFFALDSGPTTWHLDTAYVLGNGTHADGAYGGLSATQRFGHLNTTFRALGSAALGDDSSTTPDYVDPYGNGARAVGSGALLMAETSWTIPTTDDVLYADGYWGINDFTSAARGPDRGGPLGRVGILFAAQPIGRYGSALSSNPDKSAGAVLGYQKFLNSAETRQVIFEVGTRIPTDGSDTSAVAAGARFQQAFGQHFVLQLDTFGGYYESTGFGYGGRVELRVEF